MSQEIPNFLNRAHFSFQQIIYFTNFSLSEYIIVLVHMAMNTYIQYLIRVLNNFKKINAESLSFNTSRACVLCAHTELQLSAKEAESGNYGCVRNFGASWSSRSTVSFDKNTVSPHILFFWHKGWVITTCGTLNILAGFPMQPSCHPASPNELENLWYKFNKAD